MNYLTYLLQAFERKIRTDEDRNLDLPNSVNVVKSTNALIRNVFDGIMSNYSNITWLKSRDSLATINSSLESFNTEVGDCIQNAMKLAYPEELINSIGTEASLLDHLDVEEWFYFHSTPEYKTSR